MFVPVAPKKRYAVLDGLRGITLCSMVLYHGCWDLVWMFFTPEQRDAWPWELYTGLPGHVWQQSVCWTFILLSGFCAALGRPGWRRGAQVFAGGAAVTVVTLLFSYESRVIFGVLTFLGTAMLLTSLLAPLLQRVPVLMGLGVSGFLFYLCKPINQGWLQLLGLRIPLPRQLYVGWLNTFLGFPKSDFYSTDYFSLLPWLFLFWSGWFFCRWLKVRCGGGLPAFFAWAPSVLAPFAWLGRHSLLLYLLHQPVLYALLWVWDAFLR